MTQKTYTALEAAQAVGISKVTWYAWIKAGCVRSAPIRGTTERGGRWSRWTQADVDRGRVVRRLTKERKTLCEISQKLPRDY